MTTKDTADIKVRGGGYNLFNIVNKEDSGGGEGMIRVVLWRVWVEPAYNKTKEEM